MSSAITTQSGIGYREIALKNEGCTGVFAFEPGRREACADKVLTTLELNEPTNGKILFRFKYLDVSCLIITIS